MRAIIFTFLLAISAISQVKENEVRTLTPEEPIERELKSGESHSYRISLKTGQFLHLTIEQRGIDVVVRLFGPDGSKLAEMNNRHIAYGVEPLSAEASGDGDYRIEIAANSAFNGMYVVRVDKPRPVTTSDRERIEAERAAAEGQRLRMLNKAESYRPALEQYQVALQKWRQLDDRYWQATTLTNIGLVYSQLEENDKALSAYNEALPLAKEIKDLGCEWRILNNLAGLFARRDKQKAIDYYKQALQVIGAVGDRPSEALTLTNLADSYGSLQDYSNARSYYDQSLKFQRELKDRASEARTLYQLGFTYKELKQNEIARASYEQALIIERELKDRAGEAIVLDGLGFLFFTMNDYEKARAEFEQELQIRRELSDREGEASALSNIALTYWAGDVYSKAIEWYTQALKGYRDLKNREDEARVLTRLGYSQRKLNQFDAARQSYIQALEILHDLKDRNGEASVLDDLGMMYLQADEYEKSVPWYEQALLIQRELNNRSDEKKTLERLGFAYRKLNQTGLAIRSIEHGLEIARELKNRKDEASLLDDLGLTYFLSGDYQGAIRCYDAELTIQRELKDRAGEAKALNWLGYSHDNLKEFAQAYSYHEQVLAIRRELKDSEQESSALNSLADDYAHAGQNEKALSYYNQSLAIRHNLNDRSSESASLTSIASFYYNLNDFPKAVNYYEQALQIAREIKNPEGEASALWGIASAQRDLAQYEKAIESFEQARAIRHATKNSQEEIRILNSLAMIQLAVGGYERAFANFMKALDIARASGNRAAEGLTLNALGSAYSVLGQRHKAIDYYEQALAIAREVKNRLQECIALATLGFARLQLGEYAKSIEQLNQARSILVELKSHVVEPTVLAELGMAHEAMNQSDKAIEYFEQALTLARELKTDSQEAIALAGLAQSYIKAKQYDKAQIYCDKGLAIVRAQKSREGQAGFLALSMTIWSAKQQPELAIIFGKQSINILQQIRLDLRDLDKTLQQSFIQDKKYFYRNLADLLVEQGRLPEAQQILGLLKEEEYYEFVRRDAAEGSLRGAQINFTPAEASVEKQFAEVATHVAELGAQRAALLALTTRTSEQEKQLSELETKLESANQAFEKFLDQLDVELKKEKADSNDVTTLRESQALMATLRELDAVALYTIVGKEKYRVILITPDVQKAYEYSITEAELNKKVFAFREVLQNPNLDPIPQARELYRILIGPELARDIEQTKIKTIMWSLDGTLRYLPVAALHDDSAYLVETYRNVVFTLASRDHLKDPVSPKWEALGVGVSREREVTDEETKKSIKFPALPGVREELGGIVRQDTSATTSGVLDGKVLLDEAFTTDALRSSLRLRGSEQPFKVVHIASHFNFQPGDETKSFLLMGDGTLTLAHLKGMLNLFSKVELLTLSACNTATGDSGREGKEVEGFAVLAQRQGAEAIIATLWPVSDPSTSELMRQFYRLREEKVGVTKAEALRQAQLRLLKGGNVTSVSNSGQRSSVPVASGPTTTTAPPFKQDPNAKYSHPYYWAPFILIGNWK